MSLFTKENLINLEKAKSNMNLTIMVPTFRANKDEQNRIGFKNAVKETEELLSAQGKDEEEIKQFMRPLNALFEKEHFWDHQSDALVIFMNKDFFEYHTLPVSVKQTVYSGQDFYVKPLLNLLEGHDVAHIMTVSSSKIRLLSMTNYQVVEHDISDQFPQSMKESKWHIDQTPNLQSHGSGKSLFHGHGGGKDHKEEDIKRFFRDVHTGLQNFFAGSKRKVVLAGVDNTVRLFKDTFKYDHFTDQHIPGNHDETHALDLHAEARAILNKQVKAEVADEIHEMNNLLHTDIAENSVEQIVKASLNGRVDKLYLCENNKVWGYLDKDTLDITRSQEKDNGQVDLLNQSAIQTILNGGTVRLLSEEVLGKNEAIAHLRH